MRLGTGRWTLGICIGLLGLIGGLVLVLPRDREASVTRSSEHVELAELAAAQLAPATLDGGAPERLRTEIATEAQSASDLGPATERSSTEEDDFTDEDFDPDEAEPLWAFHGMVMDAQTREPVPNAEVIVDYRGIGLQGTTDTRGRFTWELEERDEHIPFPLPAETVRVCVMVEDPLWRMVFEGEGRLSTFHVIEAGGALKWARGRVESNGPWPYGEGFLLDIARFGEAEEYDVHLARATVDGDGEFAVPLIADPSLDDLHFFLWNDSSRHWVVPSFVPLQRSPGSVLVLEAELAEATLTMDRALSAARNSPDELWARPLGQLLYTERTINADEQVDAIFFGPSIDVVGIREDHYAERVQLLPGASVVLRPGAVPWSTVSLHRPGADEGNDDQLYVVGIPVTTAELDGDLWLELVDWARGRAREYLEGAVDHFGPLGVPRLLWSSATFSDDGTCELWLPWTGPWLVLTGTASGEHLRIGHIADPTSGVVWRE